jgi:hypothetical protein
MSTDPITTSTLHLEGCRSEAGRQNPPLSIVFLLLFTMKLPDRVQPGVEGAPHDDRPKPQNDRREQGSGGVTVASSRHRDRGGKMVFAPRAI